MASVECQKLKASIEDLKASLLNFAVRPDGAYTPEELLKCRAFITFSHAEVETYLEKVSTRILDEARARWSTCIYDRVISTLLTFRRQAEVIVPDDPMNPTKKGTLVEIIDAAFNVQRKVISDNNGIKRKNLSEMFLPLGVLSSDIDEVLLIQLDQTGKLRGDLVHKGNHVSLPRIRDPFRDEEVDIDSLISEVDKFDSKLERLGLLSVPRESVRSRINRIREN